MSELKYTSGPWKAHKLPYKVGDAEYDITYGDNGERIAELVYTEADAKLIAAAPDLLESLIFISKDECAAGLSVPAVVKMMDAIRKATSTPSLP